MWLLTPFGFFSIVQKHDDDDTLTVRARVRSDLINLKATLLPELGKIGESHDTDYRFRAKAPRKAVADAMSKMAMTLDYSNFKDQVAKVQGGKRAHLYHDVWDVLCRLQGNPAYEVEVPKQAGIPVATSYGGVLINGRNEVLLREPKGHFDGYVWTFAKGRPDPGETPDQTALREVKEETGYHAVIVGFLSKAFKGGTGTTSMFLMKPTEEPGKHHEETSQIQWVSFSEARRLIGLTTNDVGRKRDLAILEAARVALG